MAPGCGGAGPYAKALALWKRLGGESVLRPLSGFGAWGWLAKT